MSKTSLDKSKIKFLLLEGVHQSAVDVLKAAGYTNIEYLTGSLPEAELKEKINEALCELGREGTLKTSSEKWFKMDISQTCD